MSDDPFADAVTQAKTAGPAAAPATAQPSDDPFAAAVAQAKAPPQEAPPPSWSEIPGQAASNAWGSLKQYGQGILHAPEAMRAMGQAQKAGLEERLKSDTPPEGGYTDEATAHEMGQQVLKRYGSIDNFKRTLATDPVGVAGDLSMLLTGGETAIPGAVGRTFGTVGRAVDPLNAITKPIQGAAKLAGIGAKEILGQRTGAGPEAIQAAASAGYEGGAPAKAFRENIDQTAPIEQPVQDALKSIDNLVQSKNANYKSGISQAGLNQPISPASSNKIMQGIIDAGDIGSHQGWQYSEAAKRANDDLLGIVQDFFAHRPQLHTVEGLDALKQAIGEYKQNHVDPAGKGGIVADTYYNAVKGAIVDQAPDYAKVMDQYGAAKDELRQLQKTFSLPADQRKLNIDTSLRKLQSIMRNNVNTSYGFRRTLAQVLEQNGAPNLHYQLAGQALSSASPRGLARISYEAGAELAAGLGALFLGHPAIAAAALPAFGITAVTSSPKLMGKAAYYAGRAASPLKYTSQVLTKPNIRAAQQVGRWGPDKTAGITIRPNQSRGGAIERALRASKVK